MKKIILSVIATVATTGSLFAQYTPDALKFSQTNYGSTARFKAMGGAQIGVGGDMSSLGANPAGLGLFTKSEFSLTPEFNMIKGNADYLNQNTKTSKNQLNLNNVGVVFYSPTFKPKGQDAQKGLISAVFGVGYNRNNDFTGNLGANGTNKVNSVGDFFAEEANYFNRAPNNLPKGAIQTMAYDNYVIGYDNSVPTNAHYYNASRNAQEVLTNSNQQTQSELRSGSTSEVNVAGALNISNQVYIGASIGFVSTRYVNTKEFTESGFNVDQNSKYDLSMRTNQETKGSGVNGRIGVIFRPISNFRVGATFQTPTWLFVDDNTSLVLDTRYPSGPNAGVFTNTPSQYPMTYRLRTPLKGSLGASYVIANKAIISADVDYTDYSSMHFSVDQDDNQAVIDRQNASIKKDYTEAVNYRIGAEYKVDNSFSLRAGYANNGSPIKDDKKSYFATKMYSGGLGYRVGDYYIDATYQRVESNTDISAYTLNDFSEPVANIKVARNNVFLTFGVRF